MASTFEIIKTIILFAVMIPFLYYTLMYAYNHKDDSRLYVKILSWIWLIYGGLAIPTLIYQNLYVVKINGTQN